jgi:hypothetical protein
MRKTIETPYNGAVYLVTIAILITQPIHSKKIETYTTGAPNALDKFQKHKLPLAKLLTFWANYFNKDNLLLNILICINPFIISPTILKTGVFSLRSSCFISIIGCLQ